MYATLALVASSSALHATFGRAHGMEFCRRMVTSTRLPTHDFDYGSSIIKARLALEHPSAFVVVDGDLSLFVCVPVGRTSHRIDAAVWGTATPRFQELRTWYASHFPEVDLTPGTLARNEYQAWDA